MLATLALSAPALAQTTAANAAGDTSVRTLLSWIDDAEVIEPGGVQVSLSASRWQSSSGHEWDAPAIFAAAGVAPRVQIAGSLMHFASSYDDGFTASGRGDAYLIGKVALVSPRAHPGGIAVSPILGVLSDLSLSYAGTGASRVNWGLPVSLQYTWNKARVYGSTGYFSRGSVFGSGAVEVFVADRVIASASLYHSHATKMTAASEAYGLKRDHTDATVGAALLVSPVVTVFGTVGRTLAGKDPSSTDAIVTAGVSFRFAPHSPATP